VGNIRLCIDDSKQEKRRQEEFKSWEGLLWTVNDNIDLVLMVNWRKYYCGRVSSLRRWLGNGLTQAMKYLSQLESSSGTRTRTRTRI